MPLKGKTYILLFVLVLGPFPGMVRANSYVLHPGITSDRLRGPYVTEKIKPRLIMWQASAHCTISLATEVKRIFNLDATFQATSYQFANGFLIAIPRDPILTVQTCYSNDTAIKFILYYSGYLCWSYFIKSTPSSFPPPNTASNNNLLVYFFL